MPIEIAKAFAGLLTAVAFGLFLFFLIAKDAGPERTRILTMTGLIIFCSITIDWILTP